MRLHADRPYIEWHLESNQISFIPFSVFLSCHSFVAVCKATELKDDRSPSDATVMTTFTILLIDKNDNAPKFNSSEYRVRITELAQVGFALPLFIQVEDKDEVSESLPTASWHV